MKRIEKIFVSMSTIFTRWINWSYIYFEEMHTLPFGRYESTSSSGWRGMKNAWGHVARHCVASNVKPYEAYAREHNTESPSRVTHGTSLGNERDKHVSVTGPPVEGQRREPSEFDAPFYLFPRATPQTRRYRTYFPENFRSLLNQTVCRILSYTCSFAQASFSRQIRV